MAKSYYKKEIPESPVFVAGHPMRFDVLETEDSMLSSELDKCAARGVGGVMKITQAQYDEEVKKKEQWNLLNGSSKPRQRQELSALQVDARRVVEAVGNPAPKIGQFAKPQVPPANQRPVGNTPIPEPIEVPSIESFVVKPPPTARFNQVAPKGA